MVLENLLHYIAKNEAGSFNNLYIKKKKKTEWSKALYVRVSLVAMMIKNRSAMQETQVQS